MALNISHTSRLDPSPYLAAWNRLSPVLSLLLLGVAVYVAAQAWPFSQFHYDGFDFRVYMGAARAFPEPYVCTGGFAGCYLYSPAFALLVSPLAWLPQDVGLGLWRLGAIAALVAATWRAWPLGLLVFCIGPLWQNDLAAGNVMAYATALMIAVIRWPSVGTAVAYAVFVAVVPKPQFLPVLAYAFWRVSEARLPIIGAGFFGLVMLAWPGYLPALMAQSSRQMAPPMLPFAVMAPVVLGLTLAGFRFPRLLGVASLLASPYALPYNAVTLGTLGSPVGSRARHLDEDQVRAEGSRTGVGEVVRAVGRV